MSFIWYINLDRSFHRFVTIHACDGQTEFPSLDRVCIACSAVKINIFSGARKSLRGQVPARVATALLQLWRIRL